MTNKTIVRIALAFLFLSSLALGGYDLSGGEDAKNMSLAQFNAMGMEVLSDEASLAAGAPQVAATDQGTELAAYTDKSPEISDMGKAFPYSFTSDDPTYIFYDGDYLEWNSFAGAFPRNQPGLWVERAAGWSWHATLPLGGWTRELLYVPQPSPITIYEIYPGGFVREYDLGYAEAGYHTIWYYADSPGRHGNILATSSGCSNEVIIDVHSRIIQPVSKSTHDLKKECRERSNKRQTCNWHDGICYCVPNIPLSHLRGSHDWDEDWYDDWDDDWDDDWHDD